MNRRTFLKSIATACGAVVVCPGELLKGKSGEPGFYDVKFEPGWQKHLWKNYYADYQCSDAEMKRLLNELETAFWNTEFKSPLIIGAYDKKIQTP